MSKVPPPVDINIDVLRTLAGEPRDSRKVNKSDLVKITVRLPAGLVNQLKQEAYALTHHKRRGFQDLVALFLQYGLDAYRRGDLELTLQEKTVEYHIVPTIGGK